MRTNVLFVLAILGTHPAPSAATRRGDLRKLERGLLEMRRMDAALIKKQQILDDHQRAFDEQRKRHFGLVCPNGTELDGKRQGLCDVLNATVMLETRVKERKRHARCDDGDASWVFLALLFAWFFCKMPLA